MVTSTTRECYKIYRIPVYNLTRRYWSVSPSRKRTKNGSNAPVEMAEGIRILSNNPNRRSQSERRHSVRLINRLIPIKNTREKVRLYLQRSSKTNTLYDPTTLVKKVLRPNTKELIFWLVHDYLLLDSNRGFKSTGIYNSRQCVSLSLICSILSSILFLRP